MDIYVCPKAIQEWCLIRDIQSMDLLRRVFHIHIRLSGDNDELYFRDFMNDNYQLAKEYEKLKLSLWKQYEHNRDAYTNAKKNL